MKELNGFEGEFCGVSLSHMHQAPPIFGFESETCITRIEMKSITTPFVSMSFEIIDDVLFDISPNKKYKITIEEAE